jgi:hypothetical protein
MNHAKYINNAARKIRKTMRHIIQGNTWAASTCIGLFILNLK